MIHVAVVTVATVVGVVGVVDVVDVEDVVAEDVVVPVSPVLDHGSSDLPNSLLQGFAVERLPGSLDSPRK
jgi:hypothetical protein